MVSSSESGIEDAGAEDDSIFFEMDVKIHSFHKLILTIVIDHSQEIRNGLEGPPPQADGFHDQ